MNRRTYCAASLEMVDVTALEDAKVTAKENISFGNILLFQEKGVQKEYGTMELNQFVLDGTKDIMPESPEDVAFWSSEKSNEQCEFLKEQIIDVEFSRQHSSEGITFFFAGRYPAELSITWYAINGMKISEEKFYPDSQKYFCQIPAMNYGKLKIKFLKTSFPHSYVKLRYIMYGREIVWGSDLLKGATLQEEIDTISANITTNTANISVIDEEGEFDVRKTNGLWKFIQKNQEVTLTENVNGTKIPCGTFYIDGNSYKENVAEFELIDAIGLMDRYQFENGEVYEQIEAGELLKKIFSVSGIKKYKIEDEIYHTVLKGHLPVQSCKEALQMVCFASAAVADDSRSDTIHIYKPDRYVSGTIGPDRKFYGKTEVELDEYVSGISILCNQYTLDEQESVIYQDILRKGKTKITFTEPYNPETVKADKGRIIEVNYNYVIISIEEDCTCAVSGRKYSKKEYAFQKKVESLEAGENENIKKFGTCTLYNANGMETLMKALFQYYSIRHIAKVKYLLDIEQVGQWKNIVDVKQRASATLIEKQTIDLVGGFIAEAVCRGYEHVVTELYFTGNELISGGDALI